MSVSRKKSSAATADERPWEGASCRSCGTALQGPHCSECGLRHAERISVRSTLTELGHHVTSMDSALLRTLRDLFHRPGTLVRRYLDGDRRWIFPPAKLAFLAAALYTLVIITLDVDVRPTNARSADPRALEGMRFIVNAIGYLLFVYLLPVAGLLPRVFRKPKMRFAEAYVLLLFWISQYLLVITVLAAAGAFSTSWGFWVARGSGFVFLLWMIRTFFDVSWIRTLLGGALTYVTILLCTILSGVGALLALLGWRFLFP